jgi:hypothetical protein
MDRSEYEGSSGLPLLNPSNDSRLNLQILMFDARQDKPALAAPGAEKNPDAEAAALFLRSEMDALFDAGKTTAFSDTEASRCQSFATGTQAFLAAVQADAALTPADRAFLTDARGKMPSTCDAAAPAAPPPELSARGREFQAYIAGAQAFYGGDFDVALDRFKALATSGNAWLKETARYMVARTLLNKSEVGAFANLDGVPQPKVTDTSALAAAGTELQAYLKAYPSGLYAASARGLLRRVYWLAGDKARLAAEYAWRIAHAEDPQANLISSDLAQEIDAKFLTDLKDPVHDANLLAVEDLMRMRSSGPNKGKFPVADLEAQAPDFAGRDQLWSFLKAARDYYVDGDAAAALQALGPAPPGPLSPAYLGFSREALRGQALDALGQHPAAVDQWKRLKPLATLPWQNEAIELGLSRSYERAAEVNKAFEGETRINSPRLRKILLQYVAGPILLRQAVADPQSTPDERQLARFFLLFKEATRGHFSGFLRDYAPGEIAKNAPAEPNEGRFVASVFAWAGNESSEPYKCPPLKAVVAELAVNARAPHGLLCLGEFVRATALDDIENSHPQADELGGGKPIFPGEPFARGDIYKALIADAATPDADRAYALYRAINCYRPAGVNTCGGKDVPVSQRKAWFTTLKSRYGSASWVRELKYYW